MPKRKLIEKTNARSKPHNAAVFSEGRPHPYHDWSEVACRRCGVKWWAKGHQILTGLRLGNRKGPLCRVCLRADKLEMLESLKRVAERKQKIHSQAIKDGVSGKHRK